MHHYNDIEFINLSICTLGVFSLHSVDSTAMLKELSIQDRHLTYIQRKISTITIKSTYYIFCQKEKISQIQTCLAFRYNYLFLFLCFVNHK